MVTIAGMNDAMLVMASLQKPKKIVFRGSDGNEYPFLAKPKDDLRKVRTDRCRHLLVLNGALKFGGSDGDKGPFFVKP